MEPGEASPKRIRLLSAVLLLATFAAGTVTGAGVSRWASNAHGMHRPPPPMTAPLPLHELNLTPDQQQKVHAVIERHRPELETILRESFPRVRAVNDKIEEEVREVLTAEQRAKLDQLKAQRAAHPGPPPGPPPGGPSGAAPDQWAPPPPPPGPWNLPPPPPEEKR